MNNLFGKAQNNPTPTDVTSRQGSAAEQDRYGDHFGASTDAIRGGIERGVDKVKQYSGYLDDDEEDKHLFYCEYPHEHHYHNSI